MNEYNALAKYPQPDERIVGDRTIWHRIIASYRGREFFDGDRAFGYGGMVYDGRWGPVAEDMIERYKLTPQSSVLQINCEKGYLLDEFFQLDMRVRGIEPSNYARRHIPLRLEPYVNNVWNFKDPFDLLIAIGPVYMQNLADGMNLLREIDRISFNSFITLASYETEADLALFKKWSLLATTILKKDEWRDVLKHCFYRGDYCFVNAETLRLRERS